RYWHAHEKIADFIGGKKGTTVFTKNATEAINMVARGLSWKPGDRIITTILEHHSNLLPWKMLEKQGVHVEIIGIRQDYSLDMEAFKKALEQPVRLVATAHVSNVTGYILPVEEITALSTARGALVLIDGAQSVPHMPIDVSALGCDFFCFSGHKMCGPTGTGVLWMKEPILDPMVWGGGMVESVTDGQIVEAGGYERYEAGTPHISGGIALGVAADYLHKIGMEQIREHEKVLITRLINGLVKLEEITVYSPESPENRAGVVSFTIKGMHPHEVAQKLDEQDILVRSGHHCCQPLMNDLGLSDGTVRVSTALYTTEEEIDFFIATLREIIRSN
ncbi:MAG: cysteine desulfurase, partial [Methanospirillum sp.]|nr:cysteine desulfurase [Methanospirillum sp.]